MLWGEKVQEALTAMKGYAYGHAEHMGDQVYFPDEDETLVGLIYDLETALEFELEAKP